MKALSAVLLLGLAAASSAEGPKVPVHAPPVIAKRTVFLMHGLPEDSQPTRALEPALRKAGFKFVDLGAPSPERTVEEQVEAIAQRVFSDGEGELYFIGHGRGGIVLRYYLGHDRPAHAARFLLIGVPNRGGTAPERSGAVLVYDLLWGGNEGHRLASSRHDFWQTLPPLPCPFGVLAGGTGKAKGMRPSLAGDNDGEVTTDEARLDGAEDVQLLPFRHAGLLIQPEAVASAVRYLETGRFRAPKAVNPIPAFRPAWSDGRTWRVEYTVWTLEPSDGTYGGYHKEDSIWDYRISRLEGGGWRLTIVPERPGVEDFRNTEEYRVDFDDALAVREVVYQPSAAEGAKEAEDRDPGPGFIPTEPLRAPILFWPDWSGRPPAVPLVSGDQLSFDWGGRLPAEVRFGLGEPWWKLAFVGEGRPGVTGRLLENAGP